MDYFGFFFGAVLGTILGSKSASKLIQNLLIFGSNFGSLFLRFWSSLGVSWEPSRASWGSLGKPLDPKTLKNLRFFEVFENAAFWLFEAPDGSLGLILPPLWPIWSQNGPQNGSQNCSKKETEIIHFFFFAFFLKPILGPSWAHLGPCWGHLAVILNNLWGTLGHLFHRGDIFNHVLIILKPLPSIMCHMSRTPDPQLWMRPGGMREAIE